VFWTASGADEGVSFQLTASAHVFSTTYEDIRGVSTLFWTAVV
jgi:hypothetical protein